MKGTNYIINDEKIFRLHDSLTSLLTFVQYSDKPPVRSVREESQVMPSYSEFIIHVPHLSSVYSTPTFHW